MWGLECRWKLHCLWGKQRHMNPNWIHESNLEASLTKLFGVVVSRMHLLLPITKLYTDAGGGWKGGLWMIYYQSWTSFRSPPRHREIFWKANHSCKQNVDIFFRNNTATVLVRFGIFMEVSAFSSNLTINAFSFKLIFLKSLQGSSGRVGKAWDWFSCDLCWVIAQKHRS